MFYRVKENIGVRLGGISNEIEKFVLDFLLEILEKRKGIMQGLVKIFQIEEVEQILYIWMVFKDLVLGRVRVREILIWCLRMIKVGCWVQ